MEYGTVWDTLGYSDSGFTGLWFAQALGASGVDYEMSYNHIVFDNHYVPEMNAIHVASVRTIVRTYLDNAQAGLVPELRPAQPIAWLDDPRVTQGLPPAQQDGAHREADADDTYEVASATSPQRFWRDLARFAAPGSIVPVSAADLAAGRMSARVLVVTGDAWDLVATTPGALQAVRAHVEGGGQLFLTDRALQGLEALGLAQEGSVDVGQVYMGYVDLDLQHPLAEGVRSLAHQTFEGIPLGYEIPEASPIWTVRADALQGAEVVGTSLAEDRASVGVAPMGQGQVTFLGALLPPANPEGYHPYGLADYAVSATGYTLVYNALGITLEERQGGEPQTQPPVPPRPAPGFEAAMVVLGLAALALRRRR
jgi:MYXO-CTERM domain-containing protein